MTGWDACPTGSQQGRGVMVFATIWWLFFWTALGLCIGSFLNVVIYRLPRQFSLRDPLWSACPHCAHRIRWYDNLPIVSYLLLGARCRDCGRPISPRYLLIEVMMAVMVLMLLDAFFIGRGRPGFSESTIGLSEQLAYDWPILVTHIILFACLLAMSAIDLEHYWVDIRFTNFATIAGFVAHTLWTPKHSLAFGRPWDTTAIVALFALVGLCLVWLILACTRHVDNEDFEEALPMEDAPISTTQPQADSENRIEPPVAAPIVLPSRSPWAAVAALLIASTLLFSMVAVGFAEMHHDLASYALRIGAPLVLLFLLIVWQGCQSREADADIAQAIYEERFTARRMVLQELALLLPAAALGLAGYLIMANEGQLAAGLTSALDLHFRFEPLSLFRRWTPLEGLATAATGYVVAGALGWTIRIVFTLAFGKEAFGTGDIHLMAAAGCVAGWPVVTLGFFLTCILAMAGWIISLPFKRSRAIPLGPWLSLSFLLVIVLHNPLFQWVPIARTLEAIHVLFLSDITR